MSEKVYKILCYGDSNTYGFDPRMGAPEQLPKDVRWTGILDAMPCYEIINRGLLLFWIWRMTERMGSFWKLPEALHRSTGRQRRSWAFTLRIPPSGGST